jgi:hypothetical protein
MEFRDEWGGGCVLQTGTLTREPQGCAVPLPLGYSMRRQLEGKAFTATIMKGEAGAPLFMVTVSSGELSRMCEMYACMLLEHCQLLFCPPDTFGPCDAEGQPRSATEVWHMAILRQAPGAQELLKCSGWDLMGLVNAGATLVESAFQMLTLSSLCSLPPFPFPFHLLQT